MPETPEEIQSKFNKHMVDAVKRLGMDVHTSSVSVIHRGGFFDVRMRAHWKNLEVLDASALEFANSYRPPLYVSFV